MIILKKQIKKIIVHNYSLDELNILANSSIGVALKTG